MLTSSSIFLFHFFTYIFFEKGIKQNKIKSKQNMIKIKIKN